ncbi:hypothetical protein Tco_0533577 [Tanacetum coccineum]
MFIEFVIQNQFFSYSLEELAQILDIPYEGACAFTDRWSLDELAYGIPTEGPYQTNPPSPDDIIAYIRDDREGQVTRIRHKEEIEGVIGIMYPHVFVIYCFVSYVMQENPELRKPSYVLYDRVMNPLTAQQERKIRKDRDTRRGRHSTSSSTFDQPSPLISTMMMMVEMTKGPCVQALLPQLVLSTP